MTDLKAELILSPDTAEVLTSTRTCDVHTAVTKGLRDYLAQLSIDWHDGKRLQFAEVIEDWADPEQLQKWPSAAVYTIEAGTYDEDSFSGRHIETDDGRLLIVASEFVQQVVVDIWSTNKVTRSALVAMCEDAFDPVTFMSGFRLKLPYYHGAHAEFCKRSIDFAEGAESAQKRWRLAQMQLAVTVSQIRFVGDVPRLDIRHEVEVDDPSQ